MDAAFLDRFEQTWSRKRRVDVSRIVAATLLLGAIGFGGLAFADYSLELGRAARTWSLLAMAVGLVAFAIHALWKAAQNWSRQTAAAEIEENYPELGQAIRTTVQFAELREDEVEAGGIATSLVSALVQQTNARTEPLGLNVVVPSTRLWLLLAGLAVCTLLLAGASGVDWEWRTASRRVALSEQPYRSLEVLPGNLLIEEHAGAQIEVAIVGRADRDVVLHTRLAHKADAAWTERTLTAEPPADQPSTNDVAAAPSPRDSATAAVPRTEYVYRLDRLTRPLEYRVTAGELESLVYRLDIRRPLKLHEVRIGLTPPSYTGLPTSTVLDANLSALQGTMARFQIAFDKPVNTAAIVFAPRKQSGEDTEVSSPEVVPLTIVGLADSSQAAAQPSATSGSNTAWTEGAVAIAAVEMLLTEDRNYSIVAEATDGTSLPDNKFRIRIRHDQPPQVSFESPDDAVEVHTLAELPMRVRVRDDFGLTKAGVIFQINNEQEIPLLAEDFAAVAAAADEIAKSGQVSPATQAILEKVLPLEHFELTQKDSIMYFAFAEDNLPGGGQRTETDMRFIDIRPFKREYRLVDPDPMPGNGNTGGLKSLEELIQRQRFALNRTMQIERRAASGRTPDEAALDQLMQFETDLATAVRDTAQGLEARGFDDTELFYQAEAAMLQAVDSLSVGKWENATLQMRDALKALIEQRDRTIEFIRKNPDRAQLAALRAFDRLQAQKLRRAKTDKEEAKELIRRLEELIGREKGVASALEESSPVPAAPESPLESR